MFGIPFVSKNDLENNFAKKETQNLQNNSGSNQRDETFARKFNMNEAVSKKEFKPTLNN